MIHELCIYPSMTVKATEKLARKLAMTGGYEVVIASELGQSDLESLATLWRERLEKYPEGSSAQEASIAGRVMKALEAKALETLSKR